MDGASRVRRHTRCSIVGERYIAFDLLATRSLHLLDSVPVYHTKPIIELLKRHFYLNVVHSTAASGFHRCVFFGTGTVKRRELA